jgi:methionine sulfoxide reductase heme-binding subunit
MAARGGRVHLTSSPVDWYAARAGGVVAYVLLTAAVLLGLTMTSRTRLRRWPRLAIEDVHRFAGLLVGTFVVIHVVTIAIDSYLPFSLASLIVPFISRYRPAWVGLGLVAAELLLALAVTNRLRNRRISYRTWRVAHYLNFAVWTAATVHGMGAGTDRSSPWLLAIEAAAIASVLGATTWRILRGSDLARPIRIVAPAAASAAGLAVALPLALGPLRFHPKPWNATRFTDALDGRIVRELGSTRGLVSMAGSGSGTQRVLVRADLLIAPSRLLSTSFQMEYLPSGAKCAGRVTSIDQDGLGFQASCRLPDGRTRRVNARWADAPGGQLADGTISSAE